MKRSIIAAPVAALCVFGSWVAADESGPGEVEEMVVMANRLETLPGNVGSAFSALEVELLEQQGIVTLEDALHFIPGAGIGSEGGQRGSISAIRMRGTEADHTLLMVDGMRITDSNLGSFSMLGGETLMGYSRVNVLRGPQSALYGSEAIGGVVNLETRSGSREGPQQAFVEGGSFGSLRGGTELQGDAGGVRWYLAGSREVTSNDRAANDFHQNQFALRVEQDTGPDTVAGFTGRAWMSNLENPGSVGPFASLAVDEREAYLMTAYLRYRPSDRFGSKLMVGYYRDEFEERGDFPFESEGEKLSIDLRNVVRWDSRHETAVGGLLEWSTFRSTATPVDENGWASGLYANHVWYPTRGAAISLGGRWEHLERWDDSLTWRATGSWQTPVDGIRMHGSYGTGFRAPSYFELFGSIPAFNFTGNPDLEAERSRGWDLGAEWQLPGDLTLDLTWFQNRIKDLIDFSPSNIGRATTEGLEVSAKGSLFGDHLAWRGSYTWLQAADETTGLRLVRRARHRASLDLQGEPMEGMILGVGGTYVAGVVDNDFSAFPSVRKSLDGILLLRAYCNYRLSEHVSLHGRVENLLDRDYEEVANYPGRGLGVFGGMQVRW